MIRFYQKKRITKMEASMKWRSPVLARFTFLVVGLMAIPIYAQTIEPTSRSVALAKYDIRSEVTLTATVDSVICNATPEMKMLAGSHLILETASGKIDASLGVFPITGEGTASVAAGERVQVTGVVKTVRGQRVLVTRLVLINGHSYKVRNEHGFVLMPVARKGTAHAEAKGGRL
jgi:hypothetical protein